MKLTTLTIILYTSIYFTYSTDGCLLSLFGRQAQLMGARMQAEALLSRYPELLNEIRNGQLGNGNYMNPFNNPNQMQNPMNNQNPNNMQNPLNNQMQNPLNNQMQNPLNNQMQNPLNNPNQQLPNQNQNQMQALSTVSPLNAGR